MAETETHVTPPTGETPPAQVTRRQFLATLGLLAGAGVAGVSLLRPRVPAARSVEIARPLLGTWARITIRNADPARAERAAARAFDAIRAVDRQMSIHRVDSDLMRANSVAGFAARPVGSGVLTVVERALEASRSSGGAYDPTVLPLLRLYGFYAPPPGRFPTDRAIAAALERTGADRVRVNRAAGTLGLERAGMALDLGSIGKGWALDRAVDALRGEGIESALVDLGGNVYGLGVPDDGAAGWTVGIRHPESGRLERTVSLRDEAVATSGNAEQWRVLDGVRVGHLFDARTGRPAAGHLSASIVARTGLETDVLSTVAFLLGPDRFRGMTTAAQAHFVG